MKSFTLAATLSLVFFADNFVRAQCPTASRDGVHVVQFGENLYRISKTYGISVADLCAWNGIDINSTIGACKELAVKPGAVLTAANVGNTPVTTTQPDMETRADEATGMVTTVDISQPSNTAPASHELRNDIFHVVTDGETVESIARMYGYTAERFRAFNNLPTNLNEVIAGSMLRNTDCTCERNSFSVDHTPTNTTSNTNKSPQTNPATPVVTGNSDVSFMTKEEQDMCNEINLMRGNPAGYITYVQEYREKQRREGNASTVEVCDELIARLRRTGPLPILKPTQCLYTATVRHGVDQKSHNSIEHVGSDGSWVWDRVATVCPGQNNAGENIVAGPSDIRRSLMLLLVDEGIENRGHRETLLDPAWKSVACHKIAKIGDMPNVWFQTFAE